MTAQPLKQDKLMLFDFATRRWVELASRMAHNAQWSHDSKYVYAQEWGGGGGDRIYRVRIADGRVEPVASSSNVRQAGLRDFAFQSLASDDSPVVWVGRGVADLYALDWEAP
jgi:hypothetical protein